ncbi:hypothetical protein DFP72DRAFT_856830 [Ephemerocybe angulata]|uniref:Uncharacterized protein n=1 Tax=Ephemerocybe angulata TaxID=980116 RepID=A0A8H6HDT3_9AGAR|nr:hypothetical protein DFP72DRAFT_856830 [Tulosesus angulatus]
MNEHGKEGTVELHSPVRHPILDVEVRDRVKVPKRTPHRHGTVEGEQTTMGSSSSLSFGEPDNSQSELAFQAADPRGPVRVKPGMVGVGAGERIDRRMKPCELRSQIDRQEGGDGDSGMGGVEARKNRKGRKDGRQMKGRRPHPGRRATPSPRDFPQAATDLSPQGSQEAPSVKIHGCGWCGFLVVLSCRIGVQLEWYFRDSA